MFAVELIDLSKKFFDSLIINHVNLSLEPGHFYGLLGQNGAGKSTLMRILMKRELPTSGEVKILGHALSDDPIEINDLMGYVCEDFDILLPMSVGKFFKEYSSHLKKWDQNLFDRTISFFQLDMNKNFKEFSRGQKMQIAFAMAIANHPKILIIDEITSVLDPKARSYVMDYLGEFVRSGGTVLMATNIVSEIHYYADHVIILKGGNIHINLPVESAAIQFQKLKKEKGNEHPIFEDKQCVPVGINTDSSISYITTTKNILNYQIDDKIKDHSKCNLEEIFIFYTKSIGD